MSQSLFSLGFGVGSKNLQGDWLETFYPQPLLNPDPAIVQAVKQVLGYNGGNTIIPFNWDKASELAHLLKHIAPQQSALLVRLAESHRPTVATLLEHDDAPQTVPGAYLKLHLISHRLLKSQQTNLEGLFDLLPNVAWTNLGAVDLNEVAALQLEERIKGRLLDVFSVDQLPKMTDYVVPLDVHIADSARVRLGAYLGSHTRVLHDGCIEANMGVDEQSWVEGSVLNQQLLAMTGEHCSIGAHAHVSIILGDRNHVESGLHIEASTLINLLDAEQNLIRTVKAESLANTHDLSFRRNAQTGAIECLVLATPKPL